MPGVVVPTGSTAANTAAASAICNTNGTAAATNGCSGVAAMAAAASNNRIRQVLNNCFKSSKILRTCSTMLFYLIY